MWRARLKIAIEPSGDIPLVRHWANTLAFELVGTGPELRDLLPELLRRIVDREMTEVLELLPEPRALACPLQPKSAQAIAPLVLIVDVDEPKVLERQ
jgi:hypothetical protein